MKLGEYELLEEIARGGMGVVYRARGPLGEVAIKRLLSAEPDLRFEQEARAAARLRHPGIVRVHDMGHDDQGRAYLVLELIEGVSLSERLKLGPFAIEEARAHALELCEALEYAHAQGVIHRDLKPANVLLTHTGAVKLTDFGLAKVLDRSQGDSLTRTGEIMGTPAYMPPEQALGDKGLMGPRSDVYGLGATLYALLTGRAPFRAPTVINLIHAVLEQAPQPPSTHVPEVPPWLDAVVLRCLAKAPQDRYASVADLRQALLDPRSESSPRRRSALALLVSLGGVVGLALAAAALTRSPPPAQSPPGHSPTAHLTPPSTQTTPPRSPPPPIAGPTDAGGTPTPAPDPFKAEYALALAASEAGRHQEAADVLNAILARDPQQSRALRGRARCRGNLGDVEGAEADATAAIALAPRDVEAYYVRAVAREQLGDARGALADLDRVLQLSPRSAKAYGARASVRSTLHDWQGALEDCDQTLALRPKQPRALVRRAQARKELGAPPQELTEDLSAALRLDPNNLAALRLRAQARDDLGDTKGAISDVERVVELVPADRDGAQTLALLKRLQQTKHVTTLIKRRRLTEAEEVVDALLREDPTDVAALTCRGRIHFLLGRLGQAFDDFSLVIEAQPNQPAFYTNRAAVRVDLGDPAGAIRDCERALELLPSFAPAFGIRAAARLRRHDLEGALRDCELALESDPGHALAYLLRGKTRLVLGDVAPAEADVARSLELNPDDPEALFIYGTLLRDRGDHTRAIEHFERALQLRPNDGAAIGARGWAHAGLGDNEAARRDLERAQELSPTPLNAERLEQVRARLAGE